MPHARLSPLVLLFALLQALSPALASIADALLQDLRTPYAHVEAETGSGCVVVHDHECVLCSIVSGGSSIGGERDHAPPAVRRVLPPCADAPAPHPVALPGARASRAPPVLQR